MTIGQIKKKYEKDAYKQAGAVKILYIGYPWTCCFDFSADHRPIPLRYEISGYFRKDYFDAFFPNSAMLRIAEFYLRKKHVGIEKLYRKWHAADVNKLDNFNQKYNTTLAGLSDSQLIGIFSEFTKIYLTFWKESLFHDSFDSVGNRILLKLLKKFDLSLSVEEMNILTASDELSSMQKERLDLINIIHNSQVNIKKLKQNLVKHSEKFHWIYNDYAQIVKLTPSDFLKHAKKLIANPKEMEKEKASIENVKTIKKNRQQFIKVRKIPKEVVEFTDCLIVISKWRDDRKANNQKANDFLMHFVQEFSKRTETKVKYLEYLWWWELQKVFSFSKQQIANLYQKRYNGVFYTGNPESDPAFYGKKARELFDYIQMTISIGKNIKGQSVFPGIVKGRITIVRNQKEFRKFYRGDILLAPNTRPEYVPIMKMASAILSEEGGITSHSAIVSRELKKPCIVGIQGAIMQLKDGDMVEVDANKGVVRKIK